MKDIIELQKQYNSSTGKRQEDIKNLMNRWDTIGGIKGIEEQIELALYTAVDKGNPKVEVTIRDDYDNETHRYTGQVQVNFTHTNCQTIVAYLTYRGYTVDNPIVTHDYRKRYHVKETLTFTLSGWAGKNSIIHNRVELVLFQNNLAIADLPAIKHTNLYPKQV